jgi:uncharacterized RDD family membrane protein YckC
MNEVAVNNNNGMPLNLELYPENNIALASRGARLAATLLDYLVFFSCAAFILAVEPLSEGSIKVAMGDAVMEDHLPLIALGALAPITVFILVQAYFMVRHSQSIGKRIMKIHVMRQSTGGRCRFGHYFWVRVCVCNLLDLAVPFFGMVDMLMIYSEGRRCLHDRIADTVVVKE